MDIIKIKEMGLDYHSLFGDFDKIYVYRADCLMGVAGEYIFVDRFDELNEICWFPTLSTSYVGLIFYKRGHEVGHRNYGASWEAIVALKADEQE